LHNCPIFIKDFILHREKLISTILSRFQDEKSHSYNFWLIEKSIFDKD
jgi:hypothetical protein